MVSATQQISNAPTAPNWETVFASEKAGLLRLISRRLGGNDGADDILQEVALAAQKSANRPSDPDEFARWLRGVAANKVKDHWRKIQRRGQTESSDEAASDSFAESPIDGLLARESRARLHEAIAQLPTEAQELITAKYLHQRSYAQLAESLQVSEKAIEYRLHKARQSLRALLTEP